MSGAKSISKTPDWRDFCPVGYFATGLYSGFKLQLPLLCSRKKRLTFIKSQFSKISLGRKSQEDSFGEYFGRLFEAVNETTTDSITGYWTIGVFYCLFYMLQWRNYRIGLKLPEFVGEFETMMPIINKSPHKKKLNVKLTMWLCWWKTQTRFFY